MNTKVLDRFIKKNILKPKPRLTDVEGAPFKLGDLVLVLDNPNNDDTFNRSYSSKQGLVEHFEYDCGCGQTYPDDPMIGVRFQNGQIAEFWKEELKLVRS